MRDWPKFTPWAKSFRARRYYERQREIHDRHLRQVLSHPFVQTQIMEAIQDAEQAQAAAPTKH